MEAIRGPNDLLAKLISIRDKLHPLESADALREIQALITHLSVPGNGANPVTIRGVSKDETPLSLSIGRLWVAHPAKAVDDGQHRTGLNVPPVEVQNKLVTLLIWDGDEKKPNILQVIKVQEQDLVKAFAQIFPMRELWTDSTATKQHESLIIKSLKEQL